ncbi:helix-turn-helix protein [Halopolyspora algeriensis]|uniref:Helix-turn-helix protein n=2 Tax=Halopolyspora algeriensis TaxID=1500506 RepID=A0A368VF94_9ACTN|nr:helix-turn-helix protein [Halopolyspora algeriensis]TQM56461.1 helix-turn-helix protein [Halopolyspora algeriensis]
MSSSSAQLRRLGAELRRLRELSERTQTDVGMAIGRTHATLVNWERGKTKISKSDLACLLAELRAPAEVRKGLEQLRSETGRRHGQWSVFGLADWLRPLVSFEEDAVAISAFEPVVVPGLLQTREYARAIHVAGPYTTAPDDVDRWVEARMQRQLRLTDPLPLRFHAVVSESALRSAVGGPKIMCDQLRHLAEVAAAENITLQVLPASVGAHPGMASNLTVLHFADPETDPPLGYFDGPLGGYMIDDEGDVASMVNIFEDVRALALDEAASARLIAAILDEHHEKGSEHVRSVESGLA